MRGKTTKNADPESLERKIDQLIRLLAILRERSLENPETIQQTFPTLLDDSMDSLRNINQRISEQINERDNLASVLDISSVFNSILELDEVLKMVMDTIIRLTHAERGFLMLKEKNGKLKIQIARNWERKAIDGSEYAISKTVINRVINDGKPIFTTNAQEDPRFDLQASVIAYSLRSILCVPLKVKGIITGAIYTDNRIQTGIFQEKERNLLVAFANHAAIAIENARLFESVKQTLAEVTAIKNQMDIVFSSIASGVLTTDNDLTVTLINRAAETILGKNSEQTIGTKIDQIFPSLTPFLKKSIGLVQKTDNPIIGLEASPVLPERGLIDLRFNISPLKDASHQSHGVAIVLDDLTEKKHLQAQRKLFERMVSPTVINQIDPDRIQLGGERSQITTFFADIRGFTTFSENVEPETLVAILNQYLAVATEAILSEGGTIDKFFGDAIMAWFNAPLPQPDHTLKAVCSALKLRNSIHILHKSLPEEYRLPFGIGIHFGEAILGLIGSESRVDYTAIGDSVNTAKRIQENSARNQILISSSAYELVKDHIEANPAQSISARGKREPIMVYEVLRLR